MVKIKREACSYSLYSVVAVQGSVMRMMSMTSIAL